MALSDHKITDAGIAANGVQSQPDRLTGTAAQNKAVFDKLIADVVQECLNGLIDAIMGTEGAAGVGISAVSGLTGVTHVQGALAKIEEQLQEMTQGSVADGAITAAKLAALCVTTAKLADAAVTAAKLAANAVETAKIKDANVTAAKLAAAAVETAKIKDGNVTTVKIADAAVTAGKLAAGAVGTDALDALSVTTGKLSSGAVTAGKLASGAVETAKLAAGAVTAPKLADGAVTAAKLLLTGTGAIGAGAVGAVALSGDYADPSQVLSPVVSVTASRAIAAADAGKTLAVDAATEVTLTLPNDADMPLGTEIMAVRMGAGAVTFAAATGATLVSANSAAGIAAQYSCAVAKLLAVTAGACTWLLTGALA